MDRIEKVLRKFSSKERRQIKAILLKLRAKDPTGLDIQKLKGRGDIFRVKKGRIRVMYRLEEDNVFILKIERRAEKTYKKL
ncbi:hypothetical protein HYT33_01790 [Candidatus Roizmanbacteria bacterium]|nr:hypothetical protein [Candidatus Roizmanbacteria bacterium]